jgi:hypothetical protein
MFSLLLIVIMFFALIVQHFLGTFPGLGGQVLLLPVIFFYAAAALPLWGMLAMAFLAGLMWDCLTAVPVDGKVEVFFGWNILLYGALGAVMNGLHPLFIRGRWQIHCLLTGVLTSLMVLIEFTLITFRREPFAIEWPVTVWRHIMGSGLAATLIAPFLFFSLNWIGRRMGHFERARISGIS